MTPAPPGCGDGVLTDDEACDDGNRLDDDGCGANCLWVQAGFSCSKPGVACHPISRCGDGIVAPTEACDDAGKLDGDGCSASCKLELGHKCAGSPSQCSATVCGDNTREGAEGCDDGNLLPFDGCSATCQAEPRCAGGPCDSECGDALVLGNEACDDGNTTAGDGCSPQCQIEPGFTCVEEASCEQVNGQCVLQVPAIFRDFKNTHVDFGHGCAAVPNGVEPGIAVAQLGSNGKPQLSPGAKCVSSAASFAEWYSDSPNNVAIVGSLTLFANGSGGFVNRYGPSGEQWENKGDYLITNYYCGMGPGDCTTGCTVGPGQMCFYPCPGSSSGQDVQCLGTKTGAGSYDGNPLFFPIDDSPQALADARYEAMVPGGTTYGYQSWVPEKSLVPGAGLHNFLFTTEVHYWFKFDEAQTATFDFTGDDDVFVFINGRLAVDLGGVHAPLSGSATISAATAAGFGLEAGKVYEIAVFHAERNVAGSSFRLTLAGFQAARSECSPTCGDGIPAAGEECDDGVNDGGYGECHAGCMLGPFCGDGVVQEGESCDDGNRVDGDGCGSGCRNIVVK